MTKTITILGSTGSIGRQTLSVADELGLRVAALTAERNVDLMEAQCRKYRPKLAVLADEAAAEELKVRLADMNIRVLAGAEALCEAAALPEADTVVVAVCGFAALRPTLTAIHEKSALPLPIKRRWSARARSCNLPRGNPALKLFPSIPSIRPFSSASWAAGTEPKLNA